MMLSIEQRVKIVEDRMADHNQLFADMRQGLRQFEARVDARFAAVDVRFTAIDARFTALDTRLTELGQKFDAGLATFGQRLDASLEAGNQKLGAGLEAGNRRLDTGLAAGNQRMDLGFGTINQRLDAQGAEMVALRREMTTQMATHLRWTAGLMLTGFVAIVTAMLAG